MPPRFFCAGPLRAGATVQVSDAVAHHMTRVLRLRVGEAVTLFDGAGGEYSGRIVSLGARASVALSAREDVEREANLAVTLAQALPGGDKMDLIVQKAVELGAAAIVPVVAERSVVRLSGERAARRVEHWRQVAVAACEQCGRNRVPQVGAIEPLAQFLAAAREQDATRLVLAPQAGSGIGAAEPGSRAIVLIGPEGGFGEGETAAILSCGFAPVRLGRRILRTETAGLVALATLLARSGEF